MTQELIIMALIALILYYYWKQKPLIKPNIDGGDSATSPIESTPKDWTSFLKNQLNSNNLEELKSKLGEKTLDELIEENSDWETEVDTLTRSKNSLEADLLAQSNAFQSRLKEKDRELKRLKEDLTNLEKRAEKSQTNLTSEKQQHKGSLERIKLLTEQITNLTKEHQSQLKAINCLFDPQAKDYQEIDFNGLYSLLEKKASNE